MLCLPSFCCKRGEPRLTSLLVRQSSNRVMLDCLNAAVAEQKSVRHISSTRFVAQIRPQCMQIWALQRRAGAAASWALEQLRQRFIFVDYVHQHHN